MRISNLVRKAEDKTIAAFAALRSPARKVVVTAVVVMLLPSVVVAGATIGAIDCGVETLRRGAKLISEV